MDPERAVRITLQQNIHRLCERTTDLNNILLSLITTNTLTTNEYDTVVSININLKLLIHLIVTCTELQ